MKLIKKLLVLFIVLPALSSFVTIVYGSSILFLFTSPLFEMYLNSFEFKAGLISAAVGSLIIQITLYYYALEYVFPTKEAKQE